MGNDTKIYGDKEKITRKTHLTPGQILWGKTDTKENCNHYKIIFDIIDEPSNRKIRVIGITRNPQKDFLKINPKDFCGETKIDGWLDVKYLNDFSYQEFLAMPELYLEQKVIADSDLILNIKNMLNKLYELKKELKQTQQILEIEREEHDDFKTNVIIGSVFAGLATVGAFFLGKHIEEENNKKNG